MSTGDVPPFVAHVGDEPLGVAAIGLERAGRRALLERQVVAEAVELKSKHRAFVQHAPTLTESRARARSWRRRCRRCPRRGRSSPCPSLVLPLTLTCDASSAERRGEPNAHQLAVRRDARLLGDDRDVDLLHDPAERPNALHRDAQHLDRVAPVVGRIVVGEHLADVAGRRGAEDRVGDRVRDGVAVGVSDEMHVARNGERRRG